MSHAPVRIKADLQAILGISLIERFQQLGGFVLTTAVTSTHVHLLVKMPRSEARQWVGMAKKHAWFEMRNAGWNDKLWAKRGKVDQINDKKHHRNCFIYIVKHFQQGAWVWVWEGIDSDLIQRILDA